MARNQFRPDDDGRRWTYKNFGFRRGGLPGGSHRRHRRHRRRSSQGPGNILATVVAILALFGAIALGGIFLALLNQLTGH